MLGSDRSDFPKFGLIASVVLAAVVAFSIIGTAYLESSKYQRQADNQAREHAAYTDGQIRQSCRRATLREVQD